MVRLHHGIPHGMTMVRPCGITTWSYHGNRISTPWCTMVYHGTPWCTNTEVLPWYDHVVVVVIPRGYTMVIPCGIPWATVPWYTEWFYHNTKMLLQPTTVSFLDCRHCRPMYSAGMWRRFSVAGTRRTAIGENVWLHIWIFIWGRYPTSAQHPLLESPGNLFS